MAALQTRIESAPSLPCFGTDDAGRHIAQELHRFYKQNGYRPVWSDGRRAAVQTADSIRPLRAADAPKPNVVTKSSAGSIPKLVKMCPAGDRAED